MPKKDVGKLKERAAKFLKKGKLEKALDTYQELENAAKDDLRVPQKVAEILLKTGRKDEAVLKYRQAAEKYREKGFLVQAIAIYKVITDLVPDDQAARQAISELSRERAEPMPGLKPRRTPAKAPEGEREPPPPATPEAKAELEEEPAQEEASIAEPDSKALAQETEAAVDSMHEAEEPEALEELTPLDDEDEVPAEASIDAGGAGDEYELSEEEEEHPEVVPLEDEEELPPVPPERTPLFSDLSSGEFDRVFELLESRIVEPGEILIEEGEEGGSIFIIARGKFKVTCRAGDGREEVRAHLGPGEFFGEIGYFHGKRTATVTAVKKSHVLELGKKELDGVVEEFPRIRAVLLQFYRERVMDNLLADSPLFAILSNEERKSLAERFEFRDVPEGEVVVNEGDPGDSMFLIKSGKVSVSMNHPMKNETVNLAQLGPGDFFGEVSLVKNKPRTATIRAEVDSELMELKRPAFEEIASLHPEITDKIESTIEQRVEDTIHKMLEE